MFRIRLKRKLFLVAVVVAVLVLCLLTLVSQQARIHDESLILEDLVELLLTEDDLVNVGSEAAQNATLGASLHPIFSPKCTQLT
jgi:uncharacterized membrane protein